MEKTGSCQTRLYKFREKETEKAPNFFEFLFSKKIGILEIDLQIRIF